MEVRGAPPPPRPAALTPRDRRLLAFAAEHRIVLAAQLARLFGCSEAAMRRRLGTLRAAGLVAGTRRLRHEPIAWAITRPGLAAIGSTLGPPRPLDLAAYRHDVGLGWLAAAAHAGRFGELSQIVTERRMRSEDARAARSATDRLARARHGIALGGWGAGPRLHYPDLVLVTPAGHRVAVELELTTKAPARRERILAAYAVDPSIDAVLYLVDRPAAVRALARSAARAGATGKLRVQPVAWADGHAPGGPAHEVARSRAGGRAPSAAREPTGIGARR